MSSCLACRAEQGARPVIPTQVAVEKVTTESNSISNSNSNSNSKSISNSIQNNPLMKATRDIVSATFNVRTIKKETKISELIASAIATNHDIIFLQEHRLIHEGVEL